MNIFKYLIVGIIIGALFATVVPAGAAIYKSFNAVERPDYILIVDGKKTKLDNAPVTINGSSYLPVREVATLVDKDVSFKSGIITLTSKKESEGDNMATEILTEEWISLRDLSIERGLSVGKTQESKGLFRIFKDETVFLEFDLSELEQKTNMTISAIDETAVQIQLVDHLILINKSDFDSIFQ